MTRSPSCSCIIGLVFWALASKAAGDEEAIEKVLLAVAKSSVMLVETRDKEAVSKTVHGRLQRSGRTGKTKHATLSRSGSLDTDRHSNRAAVCTFSCAF